MYTSTEEDKKLMRTKNLSMVACQICDCPIMAKDVRKPALCSRHSGLQSTIARYQNYQKRTLTPAEKERILSSRTVSGGRFNGRK